MCSSHHGSSAGEAGQEWIHHVSLTRIVGRRGASTEEATCRRSTRGLKAVGRVRSMSQVEQRRVAPQEWHDAVRTARDEGYAYFDWLSAVDETDADPVAPEGVPEVTPEGVAEIAPEGDAIPAGFDVVCHLIDVRGAGRAGGL